MSEKQYKVKEIFYSIQGEGFNTGQPAIFIRFSGCNLWSGNEKDKESAVCKFCDTDIKGIDGENGGIYTKQSLLLKLNEISSKGNCRFLILTGGEPLLQVDEELIDYLKLNSYFIALETNGTIRAPYNIDWITVSPKYGSELVQKSGHELKLVYPQDGLEPKIFEFFDFNHFYLQPKFDEKLQVNIKHAVDYCLMNPFWKLSLQSHKFIGIK